MLLMVMVGLAFWNVATSSSHSLCCTGNWAAGGAQSMLTVTLPLDELGAGVLEHAAAPSPSAATAVTAAIMRLPDHR